MRNRIKKYCGLMAAVLVVGCGSSSVVSVAAACEGNVYDHANLLTDSEIQSLNEDIAALEEESGWNVYAVTTDDAQGKSAVAYADDFFDSQSTEQEDGVALLIDMDNREITISTCGEAVRYLDDERVDSILDEAFSDISDGRYGDCMETMLDGVTDYYHAGIPEGQYNYDTETGEVSVYRKLTMGEFLIALVVALGVGVLVYGIVVGKYRLKFNTDKYDFKKNGRVKLNVKEDNFINQTLTHRHIPQQTSGGGGGGSSHRSSTHRSSSGRSHGGGSRKF